MNPVARAVSSLLKSSSVWSTPSNALGDEDRSGGGSEPDPWLLSTVVARPTSTFSARSGADSYTISDMSWALNMVRAPYRYQSNVDKLLIRDPEAVAQFSDNIFICLHFS
jgi:hypothetical protein